MAPLLWGTLLFLLDQSLRLHPVLFNPSPLFQILFPSHLVLHLSHHCAYQPAPAHFLCFDRGLGRPYFRRMLHGHLLFHHPARPSLCLPSLHPFFIWHRHLHCCSPGHRLSQHSTLPAGSLWGAQRFHPLHQSPHRNGIRHLCQLFSLLDVGDDQCQCYSDHLDLSPQIHFSL